MQIGVEHERVSNLQPDTACVTCHVHYEYREGEEWFRAGDQLFCSTDCLNEGDDDN